METRTWTTTSMIRCFVRKASTKWEWEAKASPQVDDHIDFLDNCIADMRGNIAEGLSRPIKRYWVGYLSQNPIYIKQLEKKKPWSIIIVSDTLFSQIDSFEDELRT
jgi:hypothetical protein